MVGAEIADRTLRTSTYVFIRISATAAPGVAQRR
jgi:hypothetical protein